MVVNNNTNAATVYGSITGHIQYHTMVQTQTIIMPLCADFYLWQIVWICNSLLDVCKIIW